MENKKLKHEHEVFIQEMIEHGNYSDAYRKAYPHAMADVSGSAYRLAHRADIEARIKEGILEREQEIRERLDEEHYQRLLSVEKKRTMLSKIINGEIKIDKLGYDANGSKPVPMPPNYNELCRLLDTDSKLAKEVASLKQKLPKKFFINGEEFK
jgi:hypothetical protein